MRRDNKKTVTVLDSTGREFKSIFQNALDGILILDDQGICIEANPAAFAILGADQEQLLRHSLGEFYSNPQTFANNWASFLQKKYQRGSAEFLR
ncbi:MAG: PAS domain-containing protein, partial [Candidatus Acidiferrum sp.]